jgi:single-strand DNA-binding protein
MPKPGRKDITMSDINEALVVGHLAADPELRYTKNNIPVCNLRVYTNRRWKDKTTGQPREKVDRHTVVCWNADAENAAKYLHKGSHVLVRGRYETREFLGAVKDANGNVICYANNQPVMAKRYAHEIQAAFINYLDKRPTENAYGDPRAYTQGAQSSHVPLPYGVQQQYANPSEPPDYDLPPVDVYTDIPGA